jgi:hypothetical protein
VSSLYYLPNCFWIGGVWRLENIPVDEESFVTFSHSGLLLGSEQVIMCNEVEWSHALLPVNAKEIYGKDMYDKIRSGLNSDLFPEQTTITFLCHSHGGNVAFMNGFNFQELEYFLKKAQQKRIAVEYHLFETPVLPAVESSLHRLLDTYDNLSIYTYTAANDIMQCYDVFSNFPFCNRVYSINHDRLYQYKISSRESNIGHNDVAIFLELFRECFYNKNTMRKKSYQAMLLDKGISCNIERLNGKHYHGFLNKLFFYHGGKIFCMSLIAAGVCFIIKQYGEAIALKCKKLQKYLKRFFSE